MFLNYSIPKSGSTFVHLVISEYMRKKSNYLTLEDFRARYPTYININNNLNFRRRHLSQVRKLFDDKCDLVIRSHDIKIFEFSLNLKCPFTFVFRDPFTSINSVVRHYDHLLSIGKPSFNNVKNMFQAENTLIRYEPVCSLFDINSDPRCFPYEKLIADPFLTLQQALEANGVEICEETLNEVVASFSPNTDDRKKLALMKSSKFFSGKKVIKPTKLQKKLAKIRLSPLRYKLGYSSYSGQPRLKPTDYFADIKVRLGGQRFFFRECS